MRPQIFPRFGKALFCASRTLGSLLPLFTQAAAGAIALRLRAYFTPRFPGNMRPQLVAHPLLLPQSSTLVCSTSGVWATYSHATESDSSSAAASQPDNLCSLAAIPGNSRHDDPAHPLPPKRSNARRASICIHCGSESEATEGSY